MIRVGLFSHSQAYHHFVQHAPRRVRHLVELVDATNPTITQDKSTAMTEWSVVISTQLNHVTDLSSTSCFESGSRVT